ncbi:MAG TPA: glycosyltransferase family 2 protein [Geodermatophilus sp.]|nr:glycosyltransferase family 2 protein [Geodermatophilus sp.]
MSVIMPCFGQEAFLPAAVTSLLGQSFPDWELVVVDDGSPGDVRAALGTAVVDPRVRLEVLAENVGLGAALNRGLEMAVGQLIAYLPCDDRMRTDHLASLVEAMDAHPASVLAFSGLRYHQNRISTGRVPHEPLQLVQVMHRRTTRRWLERPQLTTDDLDRMFWSRMLADGGEPVGTGVPTATWGSHPGQRHRVLREPAGGLNPYRSHYRVQVPLRLQSSVGHLHDEVAHYRRFRERPAPPPAPEGLRILLVGELAHNPERIIALAERGHQLYGLWTDTPAWFNTVGPLPFGHVTEVPRQQWQQAVRALRPDVIYALLNWQAVPFVHQVLTADLGVPFVWHFKESPFTCIEVGTWPQLVDLHVRSDGQIYSSPELRDWFAVTVPATRSGLSHVLDGDLPKSEWFTGDPSPLLSHSDGEIHTVIPGRPLGPAPEVVGALAAAGVHVHVYSEKAQAQMSDWVAAVRHHAPRHLHLHAQVDQQDWVAEFSRYDAGWLHDVRSTNRGDLHAATWDDLNYPARIGTLAQAGVPMILPSNSGHLVATQTLLRQRRLGLLYSEPHELIAALRDRSAMSALRRSVWEQRAHFTFDAHVDNLTAFFRAVIATGSGTTGT